jgi:diguanylate cyclase (GGDEF)-like protein
MPPPPDSSLKDEATGLSNRRHFDILYHFLFNVADRGVPVTLVLFQLDDPEGADAEGRVTGTGAEALVDFAGALASATRTTDLAARFSPDRLVALLVDCNQQGGLIYADRVLDAAQGVRRSSGRTVSVGIATYEKEITDPDELISRAEAALEGARKAGGDRIMVPGDLA